MMKTVKHSETFNEKTYRFSDISTESFFCDPTIAFPKFVARKCLIKIL